MDTLFFGFSILCNLYISPFKDQKEHKRLEIFKKFCDRCRERPTGRYIISKFNENLMNDFFEAYNLKGRFMKTPKYYEDNIFDMKNAVDHFDDENFDYRISLFWSTLPSPESYKTLNKYCKKVLETIQFDEMNITRFLSRLIQETVNFTQFDNGIQFFKIFLKSKSVTEVLENDDIIELAKRSGMSKPIVSMIKKHIK